MASRALGLGGRLHLRASPGAGTQQPPPLQAGPLQLNVHALLLAANADKLLLDLQQAAVYFQRQKQVLQGSLSSCSWTALIWRFTHLGGGGASLRLMGRTGASRPPPALLWETGRGTFGTAHFSPHQKPRQFGDNAVKLETNLSPPQALYIPLKIQIPLLKNSGEEKKPGGNEACSHVKPASGGPGAFAGAPQRWGQNSREEPSPNTGSTQQRAGE